MNVYLDSSTVLRLLFRDGPVLPNWGKWQAGYASELLGVATRRVVDRLRLTGALDDAAVVAAMTRLNRVERGLEQVGVTRTVLRRASMPMGTVVKTLDAIHLASALLLRERLGIELIFATHDRQQGAAATALGFPCSGL